MKGLVTAVCKGLRGILKATDCRCRSKCCGASSCELDCRKPSQANDFRVSVTTDMGKKRTWWDRLEAPLASLALAATVFGALRKSGHLAQWQRNDTPWSVANTPSAAAGPPARKKQRLTPGPTGLQVTANALAPVLRAATAVPAAAAHAAVSATLGPVAADVAASEGRRIAAAVIASVLAPASGAASAPAVSVPAVIVPTTDEPAATTMLLGPARPLHRWPFMRRWSSKNSVLKVPVALSRPSLMTSMVHASLLP